MTDSERTEQTQQVDGLAVVSTVVDGIHVVTLSGEIDHHTGEVLRRALEAAGTAGPRVVVDMRQVTFMDSSGINLFIAAHHTLTEAGGWLRLAGSGETVRRTLQIVGIDTLIDCRETLRHALTD
ncbi:STAS domain-containing protein [Streptomyces sp. JHA26]|uniref:STAS domain-containing protein n=1 Tax=Streptomyces sp. JHA26 TaxID=1917143 RepID=UPI00209A8609|nr:STAS domain-containing protein [Streptomyces sp. JHA26]